MLGKLRELRESITESQREDLGEILGKDMKRLFFRGLASEDEETAKKRIGKFGAALRQEPTKAFRLYRKMSKEQRAIIQEFMED